MALKRGLAQLSLLSLLAGTAAVPAWAAPAKPVTLPRWQKPADPEPLLTSDTLEVLVVAEKGELRVLEVQKRSAKKPQVLPRFRGRFEVRLLSSRRALRDVVRFDLPLTGGVNAVKRPEQDDALARKLSLGVSARIRVRVPLDPSIASAYIYDQLTHRSVAVDISRFLTPAPALKLPASTLTLPAPAVKAPAPGKKDRARKAPKR